MLYDYIILTYNILYYTIKSITSAREKETIVIVEYLGQRSRSAADHIIELPPTLIIHNTKYIRNDIILI